MRVLVGILLIIATSAHAPLAHADESLDPNAPAENAPPVTNRINLRIGGASTDHTGHPVICLDVRIVFGIGVESCGTGQSIIHNDPGREMAHFRGTWTALQTFTSKGTGKLRVGAGFAELQVGQDQIGLQLDPTKGNQSVTGPEAAVQGQWLVPLGKGVELVTSFTAGLAYFSSADKLEDPQRSTQPFVSAEFGIGW